MHSSVRLPIYDQAMQLMCRQDLLLLLFKEQISTTKLLGSECGHAAPQSALEQSKDDREPRPRRRVTICLHTLSESVQDYTRHTQLD